MLHIVLDKGMLTVNDTGGFQISQITHAGTGLLTV